MYSTKLVDLHSGDVILFGGFYIYFVVCIVYNEVLCLDKNPKIEFTIPIHLDTLRKKLISSIHNDTQNT